MYGSRAPLPGFFRRSGFERGGSSECDVTGPKNQEKLMRQVMRDTIPSGPHANPPTDRRAQLRQALQTVQQDGARSPARSKLIISRRRNPSGGLEFSPAVAGGSLT